MKKRLKPFLNMPIFFTKKPPQTIFRRQEMQTTYFAMSVPLKIVPLAAMLQYAERFTKLQATV